MCYIIIVCGPKAFVNCYLVSLRYSNFRLALEADIQICSLLYQIFDLA